MTGINFHTYVHTVDRPEPVMLDDGDRARIDGLVHDAEKLVRSGARRRLAPAPQPA